MAGRLCGASGSRDDQPGSNRPHDFMPRRRARVREEPLNGKRPLEIYLASGEDVIGKAGRPKGSTKTARAAQRGGRRPPGAVPPQAAVEERAAAAVLPAAASDAGGASCAGAQSGRRPPISWRTAAPAGASTPDNSGLYGAFSSAVKTDFREQNLETLRKLQRKISSAATVGMVQGPLDTTGQQPPKSSSAPTHPPPSSSPMRPVPHPPPGFRNSWKTSTKGRQFTDRAQFLGILHLARGMPAKSAQVVPSNAGKVASTIDAPAALQALPSMSF